MTTKLYFVPYYEFFDFNGVRYQRLHPGYDLNNNPINCLRTTDGVRVWLPDSIVVVPETDLNEVWQTPTVCQPQRPTTR